MSLSAFCCSLPECHGGEDILACNMVKPPERIVVCNDDRICLVSWASSGDQQRVDAGGQQSADDRSNNGNPGIVPIAVAFAWYGQKGVGKARAEVPRGIDGVAGGPAQGQANGED